MTRVLVGLARRKLGAIAVAGCLVVAACGGGDENLDYVERPVDELYNEAKDLLDAREFEEAAYGFEEVERQHPYSEWAVRAQLMAAYSFYQARMYDDSVAAADRFIELHPGNDDVPYAYYLVGTSYYEQISDVGRDQEMTRQALDSFDELVRRFPDSSYARDAELKIALARDH